MRPGHPGTQAQDNSATDYSVQVITAHLTSPPFSFPLLVCRLLFYSPLLPYPLQVQLSKVLLQLDKPALAAPSPIMATLTGAPFIGFMLQVKPPLLLAS